jgi:hypothetical protein
MTIAAQYVSQLNLVETLTNTYAKASDKTVGTTGLDTSKALGAGTTPPVSVGLSFQKVLSSGAGTIDVTSITDAVTGAVKSGNGLRIVAIKFRNLSTNANSIAIVPGASNPYQLQGSDMKLTLSPGDEVTIYMPTTSQAVGSTHKTFDLTGTGSQVLEVEVLFG